MSRIFIMIGANLMFVLFSLPVITIGPGLAALFYVMLETLHKDDSLNPFKYFWKGFVMNLKNYPQVHYKTPKRTSHMKPLTFRQL